MSEVTTVLNTGQQAHFDYNTAKIFIGKNRYETATYTNSTGASVDLKAGQVMGRTHASGKITPLVSTASDGSKFPVGILAHDVTVADTASATLTFCVGGDVASELVKCSGAETLETVIDARRLRDRIAGDTLGIKLVSATEMTGYDNQ